MAHALPAAMAFSGLVVTIGLAEQLQQLRRDRDHASRMASYDALTGASSRPAIEEQLKTAVRDAHRLDRPLSVVFFDIDRFKQINDVHGHRIGDQCLRIIALRTRNRLRTYDQMGRYGGDELVVVLPDTELHEALGVAENLRSAVNCRPLSMDGVVLEASLSIGVAQLQPGETAEQLLERADAALYASKAAGRDRVSGSTRITGTHKALPPKEVVS
jgi:diguanylate cyclase (GGDEF)-like protein